jgi:hypothetical protein
MRLVLLTGALFVFAAGVQLFVLTDHTDKLFAWTIDNPLTAAFLGAFYWTALPLALLSGLERRWANARVGISGVLVFISLTLTATLIHFDTFHFHSPHLVAKGAAWLWLVIYIVDPPAVLVFWILQLRLPGRDGPRMAALPQWYRAVMGIQSAAALAVGVGLFVAPTATRRLWPWTLTPLTARAIAAWVIALGVVLATAIWENDWLRLFPAVSSYAVLGVLQGIALARYPGRVDWSGPKAWLYVLFLAGIFFVGAYGWVAAREARQASALRFSRSG